MLTAHKEGALIVFEVDGRKCTYNLATHETIGFSGRPVKSLDSQLKGYTFDAVIGAFENEHYREFLKWVKRQGGKGGAIITNPATIFAHIKDYSMFEQYFAAGIHRFDKRIAMKVSELPKPILKYGQNGGDITPELINNFQNRPDALTAIIQYDGNLTDQDKKTIMKGGAYWRTNGTTIRLVDEFGYNMTHLLRYIDRIKTYEALEVYNVLQHLYDYANMMSKISPKYDRFPRNLLTTHQIANRNYQRLREHYDESAFEAVRKPWLEAAVGDYVFVYPRNISDIKDEAVQQNNCVASYIRRVLDGRCDIMFLRCKDSKDKSLVTLEVIDQKKIVQAYQRYNTPCTTEQREAIKKWEEIQSKRKEEVA